MPNKKSYIQSLNNKYARSQKALCLQRENLVIDIKGYPTSAVGNQYKYVLPFVEYIVLFVLVFTIAVSAYTMSLQVDSLERSRNVRRLAVERSV